MAYNVLQLNADFVFHKICDLGAVSGLLNFKKEKKEGCEGI